jgi:phosphate transport system substrate-binding protein
MKMHTVVRWGLATVAGLCLAACNPGEQPAEKAAPVAKAPEAPKAVGETIKLAGAGATFPQPLYSKWCKDYNAKHPEVQVDYQGIGSGGGVKNFTEKTVDFGASDRAMKDDEIAKVDGGVVLLPMTAGAVVLSYNLDGVTDLKLSREAYTGIFSGAITKWSDPKIAKANTGAKLPDTPITVVVRADGSGTSFVFSKHLCTVNKDLEAKIHVDQMPNWPETFTKSKGNDGVAGSIKTTPGAIGYVEYGYAKTQNMPVATLENKSLKFVAANTDSAKASLAAVQLPDNLIAWVSDPEGDGCYPIVTYTWIMVYKKYPEAKKKEWEALKGVLTYGLTDGQKDSDALGYVPLPDAVVAKAKAALDTVTVGS